MQKAIMAAAIAALLAGCAAGGGWLRSGAVWTRWTPVPCFLRTSAMPSRGGSASAAKEPMPAVAATTHPINTPRMLTPPHTKIGCRMGPYHGAGMNIVFRFGAAPASAAPTSDR